jgi:hypothetical protein
MLWKFPDEFGVSNEKLRLSVNVPAIENPCGVTFVLPRTIFANVFGVVEFTYLLAPPKTTFSALVAVAGVYVGAFGG